VSNELAIALRRDHPRERGQIEIVPVRHVADWFDTSNEEKLAILALLDRMREVLPETPTGYSINFDTESPTKHLQIHVVPRRGRDRARPATSRQRAATTLLSTGGTADPFLAHLEPMFVRAANIVILAAFIQDSGVEQLQERLHSCLERGTRIRILTGDYLNLTQSRALRHLLDLVHGEQIVADDDEEKVEIFQGREDLLEVRVVEIERLLREKIGSTFHPKAWIFTSDDFGTAFVGSSNVSRAALLDGVEWNLRLERGQDPSGFQHVLDSFEQLWSRGRTLEDEWLEQYDQRARAVDRGVPAWEVESEPNQKYEPWPPIQTRALERLKHSRTDERRDRALVVLATGLGKTWLSVFDVKQFEEEMERSPRVLFLAHRVELLRQAALTFRKLFRDLAFGWYVGTHNRLTGDIVFASVMKLGRPENLVKVAPDAFDYVIVDEVHHADAKTYRKILNHLQPRFLLGMTATPERADDGDIHGLFDDHVAYEADIGVGIAARLLVPFHYFGLKDDIDYDYKPLWRNSRFNPEELARAAQTEARMEKLWEAWQEHAARRTLIFCCSIEHARFVTRWLGERGVRLVAVHSAADSADRTDSIARLSRGELDAVCTVDLFNEGVDIPSVDRVVMLRPTESPVIFLQQLGRGLRTDSSTDKVALTVIDFVGNHRVFLDRVRTLLNLAPGKKPVPLHEFLHKGEHLELSDDCSLDIELEAIDLLRKLVSTGAKQALVMAYREIRDSRGHRPTIGELYRKGFNPISLKSFDGWFEFVAAEGDLSEAEQGALVEGKDWLFSLERRERMNKSYKMVALQAMLDSGALLEGMSTRENAERSFSIMHRSPELFRELKKEWQVEDRALLDLDGWTRYWEEWPLKHWTGSERKSSRHGWFRLKQGRFEPRLRVSPAHLEALTEMTREIVDFLLARHRRTRLAKASAEYEGVRAFECKLIHAGQRPIIKLPDRKKVSGIPRGETDVRLPDGSIWRFRFVKLYCNVAHPVGSSTNKLPDLLRQWFGPAAGHPGTSFHVRFAPSPDGWWVEPVVDDGAQVIPLPSRGRLTAFPALRAAAGWETTAQHAHGIEPETVSLPGDFDREHCFAVRASGTSMQGWRQEIRDGDWLVMRWSRGVSVGSLEGRVALIARGDPEEGQTFHLKRVKRAGDHFELVSDNTDVPPLTAGEEDEPLALSIKTIRPEDLGPARGTVLKSEEIAEAFGISSPVEVPWKRVDGHLFVLVDGKGALAHPDRVDIAVPQRMEAETAFILARALEEEPWLYLGVGRWNDNDEAWAIPDVDYATWRALGRGRSASRRLDDHWLEAAADTVNRLLDDPGPGGWLERGQKSCRIVSRSSKGGLRIDGGPDGFNERTISVLDLGWVLKARDSARLVSAAVDESFVNKLRYLEGTPKGSTRWIDTGWALILTE